MDQIEQRNRNEFHVFLTNSRIIEPIAKRHPHAGQERQPVFLHTGRSDYAGLAEDLPERGCHKNSEDNINAIVHAGLRIILKRNRYTDEDTHGHYSEDH